MSARFKYYRELSLGDGLVFTTAILIAGPEHHMAVYNELTAEAKRDYPDIGLADEAITAGVTSESGNAYVAFMIPNGAAADDYQKIESDDETVCP